VQWLKERLPIAKSVFLTHGEEAPQVALAEAIRGLVKDDCIVRPRLDDVYNLETAQCALIESETKPRIDPTSVAKLDWHNDLQSLVLDIDQKMRSTADHKQRGVLVRRLRRALEGAEPGGAKGDEG
jgi:metallo-beta-lactamase family protein